MKEKEAIKWLRDVFTSALKYQQKPSQEAVLIDHNIVFLDTEDTPLARALSDLAGSVYGDQGWVRGITMQLSGLHICEGVERIKEHRRKKGRAALLALLDIPEAAPVRDQLLRVGLTLGVAWSAQTLRYAQGFMKDHWKDITFNDLIPPFNENELKDLVAKLRNDCSLSDLPGWCRDLVLRREKQLLFFRLSSKFSGACTLFDSLDLLLKGIDAEGIKAGHFPGVFQVPLEFAQELLRKD
jgi:hypothetical protein